MKASKKKTPDGKWTAETNTKSSYWSLFISFFKIGAFTLGGGYAMVPLIQQEVVELKKWVDKQEFIDMLALAQSAPGPIAVNTAIFVGYKTRGVMGSIITTLGSILPSFTIILLIALFFVDFKDNPVVERVFKGIRPAVVALIAAPVIGMAKSAGINRYTIWILLAVAALIAFTGISPIYIVMAAALGGIGYGFLRKK